MGWCSSAKPGSVLEAVRCSAGWPPDTPSVSSWPHSQDEATASVDRSTDALIQGAVRSFARTRLSTDLTSGAMTTSISSPRVLLVIAHRIDTIIDMDRILVLGAGRVLEEGSPQQLSAQAGGAFAAMVKASHVAVVPSIL